MGVDHGGSHVVVAEQFLHRTDVIAVFNQVRSERMPERVAGCPFRKLGLANGPLEDLLQDGFVHMMPPLFAGLRVLPAVFLREHPLSAPFLGRVGILAVEGVGQALVLAGADDFAQMANLASKYMAE